MLRRGEVLATTEPVVMELLAGTRDDNQLRSLRRLVLGCRLLTVGGLADYEEAAALYRTCRRAGLTIRPSMDCLIAVVAINARANLLHADADFDSIARHTDLRIAVLGS
jgi:predicted nucleic acid-binding protein